MYCVKWEGRACEGKGTFKREASGSRHLRARMMGKSGTQTGENRKEHDAIFRCALKPHRAYRNTGSKEKTGRRREGGREKGTREGENTYEGGGRCEGEGGGRKTRGVCLRGMKARRAPADTPRAQATRALAHANIRAYRALPHRSGQAPSHLDRRRAATATPTARHHQPTSTRRRAGRPRRAQR